MFAASFGRHMCMNFYKPTMGKILHVNDAGFSVPVFRETRRIKKFLLLHSFRIAQGFFELLACALLLLALSRDHQRPNNQMATDFADSPDSVSATRRNPARHVCDLKSRWRSHGKSGGHDHTKKGGKLWLTKIWLLKKSY